MRFHILVLFIILFLKTNNLVAQQRYYIHESKLIFESNAPLETIKAVSTDVRGVIDPIIHTYGFSVASESFKGFNSALQRSHFNENYLESEKYSEITFSGKIIDDIDFKKPGIYSVRAKGMFTVKGVSRERIIRSTLEVKQNGIEIKSNFEVLLSEFEIRIPRVVYQKIAPNIQVNLIATLQLQPSK